MLFRLRRVCLPLGEESVVSEHITDREWERLLARIHDGKCTPFLGAGACVGTLPLGGDVARRWAADEAYPLEDESGDDGQNAVVTPLFQL